METFSALLAICAGNSPAPGDSPHKGQWRGALMFSLICIWINGWENNREAGDLRRYRSHYDVTVMWPCFYLQGFPLWYNGQSVVRHSYLYNGNPPTVKAAFLYCKSLQALKNQYCLKYGLKFFYILTASRYWKLNTMYKIWVDKLLIAMTFQYE